MKRSAALTRRLPALLLILMLLLCSCGTSPAPESADGLYQPGEYQLTTFDKMKYRRPDTAALEALFTATADFADRASSGNRRALTDQLERCWDAYDEYCTMETLAMLRSDMDQGDEYWAEEYSFCWENDVLLEQWMDRLLVACASSSAKLPSRLLAGYDEGDAEPYSDRAVELMERENALLQEYWQAMQLDEIQLNGETVSYLDTISDPLISDADYAAVQAAYCRSCNDAAAPLYAELIRTRRALAAEFGFDSYEEFQYASYGRDYTPAQVGVYLDDVAARFAPYYRRFMASDPFSRVSYDTLSPPRLLSLLEKATADLGDSVTDAFARLKQYRLYSVTSSARKAPGAYTVYLNSYGAPFCYLGAYGDVEDFLDLAHEFGHFADACVNYNATGNLDLAETYSQAMANLALLRGREALGDRGFRNLLLLHLLSNLGLYAEQGAYADFESRAYALSDDELTVENLNALALSCARRFGADVTDPDTADLSWVQVNHLFEQPFYVVSYCVSADAAIQIAEREMEDPGAGAACYEDLLDWQEDAFLSELERVGLESPFAPGRAEHNMALVETLLENDLGDLLNAA